MTKAKAKASGFVKARDTNVPVQKTMEDLKALVRRHGAAGFGIREDYTSRISTVEFVLVADGESVPVRIPVDAGKVFRLLYPKPHGNQHGSAHALEPERRDQAERVAWRQVYVIVDALLTAVQVGIMSLPEAFMANMVVVDDQGHTQRMAELMASLGGQLPGGRRLLLGSGAK